MASPRLIERLRAEGVLRPQAVVEEAKRAGLRLPLACALLEKESGGGRNVFGHDPTIFVGAGEVTRAKYREYKKRRVGSGNTHMQGVGPCQLTWWEFQDTADREGGCWRPEVNMRVGFRHLVALIKQHGEADGARRYNGSGDAAEAYSRDLLAKSKVWDAKLAGHAVPAPAGPRLVRRGDAGELVERITQRLSVVHSRRTGKPYLDGARRRFDGEAEAALKDFQREHNLDADGVFGAKSARALNRAVELERERRKREPAKPKPAPREPAPREPAPRKPRSEPARLTDLVGAVRLRDAQTDRSWQELAAYGSRRRRLLRSCGVAAAAVASPASLANAARPSTCPTSPRSSSASRTSWRRWSSSSRPRRSSRKCRNLWPWGRRSETGGIRARRPSDERRRAAREGSA